MRGDRCTWLRSPSRSFRPAVRRFPTAGRRAATSKLARRRRSDRTWIAHCSNILCRMVSQPTDQPRRVAVPEPRDPRARAAVERAIGTHPAGWRARCRDPRRVRRIERDDVALVTVAEPDLRARENPFHRAAGAGVDRADDVKDLHRIALCAARRLGRDNRFAIARAGTNHKLYFASHIAWRLRKGCALG